MQFPSAQFLAESSLALALIAPLTAFAESEPATDQSTWAPPETDLSSLDRITLKSGETLYGDFEMLRDRKVFFDSDEFDDLPTWSGMRPLAAHTSTQSSSRAPMRTTTRPSS